MKQFFKPIQPTKVQLMYTDLIVHWRVDQRNFPASPSQNSA